MYFATGSSLSIPTQLGEPRLQTKIPIPMNGEQSFLQQSVECSLILPAIAGSLVDQVMLALLLVGLAASLYVGRKAERTRDLS